MPAKLGRVVLARETDLVLTIVARLTGAEQESLHRGWLSAARWSRRGPPLDRVYCFRLWKSRTPIWVIAQADSRKAVAGVARHSCRCHRAAAIRATKLALHMRWEAQTRLRQRRSSRLPVHAPPSESLTIRRCLRAFRGNHTMRLIGYGRPDWEALCALQKRRVGVA
jgi:hypothetical protein